MERTTLTQVKRSESFSQGRALALGVEGIGIALIANFYWQATLTIDVVGVVSVLLLMFVIMNAVAIFRGRKDGSETVDWLRPMGSRLP
jgi:uncharacterized membrane protein